MADSRTLGTVPLKRDESSEGSDGSEPEEEEHVCSSWMKPFRCDFGGPEGEDRYRDVHLQGTCYDATTVSMVAALDTEYKQLHGMGPTTLQLAFAMCLHFSSILSQVVIVLFLLVTAVEEKENPYRSDLDSEIATLDAAILKNLPLNKSMGGDDARALDLCDLKKALPGSHFLILFFWFSKISGELLEAFGRAKILMSLPAPTKKGDVMEEHARATEAGGSAKIHSTTLGLKVCFLFIVIIPQFTVGLFLMWTGAKFLYFTPDMPTLIMKSMGLAFIVSLDELMYKTFASARFKMLINNTTYKVKVDKVNWHWEMWGASVVKVLGILGLCSLLYWGVFGEVTELRKACDNYKYNFPDPGETPGWTGVYHKFLHGMQMHL